MAVTSIWPVKSRLDNVIRYARNPEKTTDVSADDVASLHAVNNVLEYTANDIKTEQRKYVSCINCNEKTAVQEFMMVKKLYGKTDDRQCYHGYQSFAEGEVTAETAHEIGVKLAQTLWGDRFQVVVATHLNTGHYHNHFVINSVSDIDGKKFYNSYADYQKMKEESDRLCKEYGLSVISKSEGKSKHYAEWKAEQQGVPTVRDLIRRDIDIAIGASVTESGFIQMMKEMGYSFKTRGETGARLKYPSLKPPDAKGWFRFHKLGDEYQLDRIIDRVYENRSRNIPFPDADRRKTHYYGKVKKVYRKHSIYGVYIRYCYQLKIIRTKPASVKRVSFLLREDVLKLDSYIQQTQLLGKYKIHTADDLAKVKAELSVKSDALTCDRDVLRKNMRRTSLTDQQKSQIKDDITGLNRQLKELCKELHSLTDIEQRSVQIAQTLKQQQYDKVKENMEVNHNEPGFRRSRTAGQNVSEQRRNRG